MALLGVSVIFIVVVVVVVAMTFVVNCDRCDFREETESYDRAKDLRHHHHIPTGHNPVIDER